MRLTEIIEVDCIKVPLASTEKRAAIFELVDLLGERGRVSNPADLKAAVWQRESTRTTGIGHGLAIPHGKSHECERLVMAIGKPAEPIEFQSIDGRPVGILFLLAGPPDQTGPHIKALAQVSRLMTRDTVRAEILDAPDAQTLYDLIAEQEEQTQDA